MQIASKLFIKFKISVTYIIVILPANFTLNDPHEKIETKLSDEELGKENQSSVISS